MREKEILLMLALIVSFFFSASLVISGGCKQTDEENEMKVDKGRLGIAEKVLANNESKLMSIPGVVAVGLSLTKEGDQPAIHVYVDVDAAGGAVPAAIPKQIDNVPVRVIKADEVKAQ
ncbi:MAG TPA: hypothetical protein VHT73_16225 [Thermodesulfobacteriota bacterium]|nr:hypothetical protein [Thermodesulfobacteriota bacterium]